MKEKGITLIALVITIIVLLILAGISIASLTGQNGILTKAIQAQERTKQENGAEAIKIAINEMMIEKKSKGEELTIDYIGDHIHEKLQIDEEDVTKNGNPVESVSVIYGDYEYEIDDKFEVSILGPVQGRVTIEATYEIIENKAIIRVTAKTEDEKGIKRIVLPNDNEESGKSQKEITIEYTVENNGKYRFIAEGNNNSKRAINVTIKELDTTPPNDAKITLSATRVKVEESITATIELSDDESGISLSDSLWILNSSEDEISPSSELWKNGSQLSDVNSSVTLTVSKPGTVYLHILSVDNCGNSKDSISDKMVFLGDQIFLDIAEASTPRIFNLPSDWEKSRFRRYL